MTLTALAVLVVPLAAACGSEKAGTGSATAETEPVTGIRWTIDSLTVDGATHRAPDGADLTLDEDGRATGSYGCNLFKGRVTFEGDRIRFGGDRETTLRACPEKIMDFESAVARALGDGALKTDVSDGRLTLTTGSGDTVRLSRTEDSPLYGTRWTVTTPALGSRAHLTFDKEEGTVAGSLGCNQVNADATVRDGIITLGVPGMTRMMCEDSLMAGERALTKLFNGTASYRIEGRNLTLTSENGAGVRAVAQR